MQGSACQEVHKGSTYVEINVRECVLGNTCEGVHERECI